MKTSKLRKLFHPVLTATACALLIAGCAGGRVLTRPYAPAQMVHYSELGKTTAPEKLNEMAVYVNPGDQIPFKITMDTDFLTFKQKQIDLVAKRKLYFMIRIPDDLTAEEMAEIENPAADAPSSLSDEQRSALLRKIKVYLGTDGEHWASIFDGKACRKLLGIRSGSVSLGLMTKRSEGLEANMIIKANQGK